MLMTHLTKITLLGAVALLAAVGCQREQVADNPTYDAEKGEVTTQFVLSVSTSNDGPTKMTATDVQDGGASDFRGIDAVHLLSYDLEYEPTVTVPTGTNKPHYIFNPSDPSSKATRDFDLGMMFDKNDITALQSSRIVELSLPLETNAVLFYGRAPRTKTKDEQGSVVAGGTVLNADLNTVSFKMENRLSDYTAFTQYADMMSLVLTYILRAGAFYETSERGYKVASDKSYAFWWPIDETSKDFPTVETIGGVVTPIPDGDTRHTGYTMYRGEKTFKDYGYAYALYIQNPSPATSLKPLEELLGEAYQKITTLVVDPGSTPADPSDDKTELRAASSAAVLRLASDLGEILTKVIGAIPTSPDEAKAQFVAKAIKTWAGYFFTSGTALSYQPFDTFKSNVKQYIIPGATATFESTYPKITEAFFYTGETHTGFPNNLGLPVGAAVMTFSTATAGDLNYHKVTIEKDIPAYGIGGGSFSVKNYVYPAEIMYWTNSPLRTNNEAIAKTAYPKTVTNWDTDNQWASTWVKNGTVKSTTQSVAVINEVNYGTAVMKTSVKFGSGTIHDNNKGIHPSEENNPIDVTSADQFRVTGVLIGGVDDEVGWDFLSKNNTFSKMVYDNLGSMSNSFAIPEYDGSTASAPVYTLTWDNCNTSYLNITGKLQDKVYVALELLNNTGKDIWGELNLIRSGGTFYLVGELDPNTTAAQANLKKTDGNVDLSRTNFQYPPYNQSTGETINAVRVFMQDYVTEVNLVFGDAALKHAYLTMPDLRASNVSLGLSVDLKWEEGLKFDDVPLGGE